MAMKNKAITGGFIGLVLLGAYFLSDLFNGFGLGPGGGPGTGTGTGSGSVSGSGEGMVVPGDSGGEDGPVGGGRCGG